MPGAVWRLMVSAAMTNAVSTWPDSTRPAASQSAVLPDLSAHCTSVARVHGDSPSASTRTVAAALVA